jgi:hypothetical protein
MAIEEVDRTVVTKEPATAAGQSTVRTDRLRSTTASPTGNETTRRVLVLLFGLVQIAIGARFVLLLLDAREANGLVSAILSFSGVFVAPFEGILRTDALHSAGSILDITSVVAFAGWTVVELIVLWGLGIFRREPV